MTRSPDEDTRPLPDGWIAEADPSTGRTYYVDTMTLNPQATWIDPRTNPALYTSHDPEMGVIASHSHSHSHQTSSSSNRSTMMNQYRGHGHEAAASPVSISNSSAPPSQQQLPLPSLRVIENTTTATSPPTTTTTTTSSSYPPPPPKVYPEYAAETKSSPVMTLAGVVIAGAMMYRATTKQ